MMPGTHDPLEYFRLRPIKAAKVSEISEATSASPVPPEERVNFHIGNPVQMVLWIDDLSATHDQVVVLLGQKRS